MCRNLRDVSELHQVNLSVMRHYILEAVFGITDILLLSKAELFSVFFILWYYYMWYS